MSSSGNDRLQLNVDFSIDQTTVCKSNVITGTSEDLIYSIDSKTYPIISHMANNIHVYEPGSDIVNLGNKAGMRNTYSLLSILQAVRYTAIKAIANGVDRNKNTYIHKRKCIDILFMDIENSQIKIDGELLAEGELDMTIAELIRDTRKSNLNIEVVSDSSKKILNYHHYAKDIFKFDGMNADNPFTPCHVIDKDNKIARVMFESDQSKILNFNFFLKFSDFLFQFLTDF